jgi:hypothetical protein
MMRFYNVPPGNHISCAEVFQNYAWPPPCTAPGAAQTAQASLQWPACGAHLPSLWDTLDQIRRPGRLAYPARPMRVLSSARLSR